MEKELYHITIIQLITGDVTNHIVPIVNYNHFKNNICQKYACYNIMVHKVIIKPNGELGEGKLIFKEHIDKSKG